MKINLKPLQLAILVKLATTRQLPFVQLAGSLMSSRDLQGMPLAQRDNEIRLQIELLALYKIIHIIPLGGERYCVAPDALVRWVDEHSTRARVEGKKYRPAIVMPLMAAALVATASGCSLFPATKQVTAAPEVISRYNAEGTPPPERMEQFYNPRTGSMVYRFCVGEECPLPTPKKPAQRVSVVKEIEPDGTVTPVEQVIPASFGNAASPAATENRHAVRESPTMPKTAATPSAAIAAQLNDRRRIIQSAAGIEPVSAVPPVTTKSASVKTPDLPATPNARSPGFDNAPILPSAPTRIPTEPSAKATVLEDTGLAVGAMKPPVQVTETPETFTAAGGVSVESFLADWARLWSAKNANAYFALYAKDYVPTYGPTRNPGAWEGQRRAVMLRPGAIKVGVAIAKSETNRDMATIRFWQTYESKYFRSRVLKAVDLVKTNGEWKIHRERLLPVEPSGNNA